ncbi:hypothetical protein MHTCC0001_28930 [Flavobacteriaceae bacterium MHTCC 0001]
MKKTFTLFVAILAITFSANAQLPYSEDFKDQNGKGRLGGTTDISDVDWTIDTSNGRAFDADDYFYVANEVFSAKHTGTNNTGAVEWQSPNINITGYSALSLSIDMGATSDSFETNDIFLVEFVIDGGTPEVLFEADPPSATGGSQNLQVDGITLVPSPATFTKAITGTGTTGYVKVSVRNTEDAEINYFDNIVVTDATLLSTDEIISNNEVKVYPNPTTSSISISGLRDTQTYSIYNVLGSKVVDGTVSPKEEINVSSLINGIYFVTLSNGKEVLKFIKN